MSPHGFQLRMLLRVLEVTRDQLLGALKEPLQKRKYGNDVLSDDKMFNAFGQLEDTRAVGRQTRIDLVST